MITHHAEAERLADVAPGPATTLPLSSVPIWIEVSGMVPPVSASAVA